MCSCAAVAASAATSKAVRAAPHDSPPPPSCVATQGRYALFSCSRRLSTPLLTRSARTPLHTADDSIYGCCNRFCPWCKICADKHLIVKEKAFVSKSGEEDSSSLTGRNTKLNNAYNNAKVADDKTTSSTNPMAAAKALASSTSSSSLGNAVAAGGASKPFASQPSSSTAV